MKVLVLAAVVALLLSACGNAGSSSNHAALTPARAATVSTATTPASSSTGASTVTSEATQLARYDGYGDMRFGMDANAFEKAWSGKLADTTPAPGSSCFYRRPMWVKQPRDFAFMFEGGHFVRYEVGTTKEAAPGGGKVGMSEAQIRALYGSNLDDEPHKYMTGAKYLRIKAPQGDGVLLFETGADGRVTRWRVGVPPQIDYVEGCA